MTAAWYRGQKSFAQTECRHSGHRRASDHTYAYSAHTLIMTAFTSKDTQRVDETCTQEGNHIFPQSELSSNFFLLFVAIELAPRLKLKTKTNEKSKLESDFSSSNR